MISVESLTRRFGETIALRDVTFSVADGEIAGFLGPNGAGKTTAMKILTGTLAPTSGRAIVAGEDVTLAPATARRRIGFMPEHVPLYPDGRVHDFLRFVGHLKGVPKATLEDQLSAIEERTGLVDVRDRLVGQLSKGYRQRVGLAQARVGDPPILILDEPTAGLDPHQIVEIRQLIHQFQGQKTVLLSSHILSEVSLLCQKVLILDRGRLLAEETTEVLSHQHEARARVDLAWDDAREAVLTAIAGLAGVVEVIPTPSGAEVFLDTDPRAVRPQLAAAVLDAGGRLQQLIDRTATLEDLFLRITARPEDGSP
jgi:ABC-2 type transport system ATP-binding protein